MRPTTIKETTYKDTWETRDQVLTNYKEYLESDEWKMVKQELKQKRKFQKCRACGNKRCIQLHHKTYQWVGTKYEELGIIALCIKCHRKVHNYARNKNVSVERATKYVLSNIPKIKRKRKKIKK
jgi:hypothetical protein